MHFDDPVDQDAPHILSDFFLLFQVPVRRHMLLFLLKEDFRNIVGIEAGSIWILQILLVLYI